MSGLLMCAHKARQRGTGSGRRGLTVWTGFGSAAFALAIVLDAARSQPAQPPPPAAPAAPATQAQTAKPYTPTLAEFMLNIQAQHAKLWLAARAQNWPLAAYQLEEIKELFEQMEERIPVYKDLPVGKMIEVITKGPVSELEKAAEAKNFKNFSAAYYKLTEACNDCHKSANRGFIVIRTPFRSPYPNQDFRPPRR
jgi:hypothetical protein